MICDLPWWEVFLLAFLAGFGWALGGAAYVFLSTLVRSRRG